MESLKVIDLVHDMLKNSPELAEITEWKKVTGLITLKAPGCSVGVDKEEFTEYTRDLDEVTAYMRITLWVKNVDPVTGEAKVRQFAQDFRLILAAGRTLGGAVDDSFVKNIEYATAEADKTMIQHIAEIDFRVTYYSERFKAEAATPIDRISSDVGAE